MFLALTLFAADAHADTTTYGAVAYDYRIGTTEVTNAQYAEFLNAKAGSDPLALYSTNMGSDARGGITRSGSDGSYSYTPRTNMGNKPVNFVGWYDAIRFANWLHNGEVSGDTETGAYTLLGGTAIPSDGNLITRNPGATWFLPSENEWYKAAYYEPTLSEGNGGYWAYPTRSNSAPTVATANSTGDISNAGANVANYTVWLNSGSYFAADWNGIHGNVTTVGSAGPLSESYYGTSDQGGNVAEMNEAGSFFRGERGGSWDSSSLYLAAWGRFSNSQNNQRNYLGFRMATVPEPSTLVLAALGPFGSAGLAARVSRRIRTATPASSPAVFLLVRKPAGQILSKRLDSVALRVILGCRWDGSPVLLDGPVTPS
jgi:formylglycine-generating enzyme required for sulfatase activity